MLEDVERYHAERMREKEMKRRENLSDSVNVSDVVNLKGDEK